MLAALVERCAALRSVIVAYSGGVDSAVVLAAAARALGPRQVLAVTGRSASVPEAELAGAAALANQIGAAHEFLDTREFDDPSYLANPANRCYYCKTELYGRLRELAGQRGFAHVASGVNADDLGDYRPGLQALAEKGVAAPLAELGLGKAAVREIAALLALPVAQKPASPCLSSRVQYGESITPEKLRRIERAEVLLRSCGFAECRVRHHDDLARIEVSATDLARFADASLRERIETGLRELGYRYVTLDLRGFRSGSMNEVLGAHRLPMLGGGAARPEHRA